MHTAAAWTPKPIPEIMVLRALGTMRHARMDGMFLSCTQREPSLVNLGR